MEAIGVERHLEGVRQKGHKTLGLEQVTWGRRRGSSTGRAARAYIFSVFQAKPELV